MFQRSSCYARIEFCNSISLNISLLILPRGWWWFGHFMSSCSQSGSFCIYCLIVVLLQDVQVNPSAVFTIETSSGDDAGGGGGGICCENNYLIVLLFRDSSVKVTPQHWLVIVSLLYNAISPFVLTAASPWMNILTFSPNWYGNVGDNMLCTACLKAQQRRSALLYGKVTVLFWY